MGDHAAVTRHSDAFERALRTLWVAIGIDIVSAIGVGLTSLMVEHDVTSGLFWAAFGVLILKSVVSSVAAYLVRLKVAPKSA